MQSILGCQCRMVIFPRVVGSLRLDKVAYPATCIQSPFHFRATSPFARLTFLLLFHASPLQIILFGQMIFFY